MSVFKICLQLANYVYRIYSWDLDDQPLELSLAWLGLACATTFKGECEGLELCSKANLARY